MIGQRKLVKGFKGLTFSHAVEYLRVVQKCTPVFKDLDLTNAKVDASTKSKHFLALCAAGILLRRP